jgi:hypothetical protein
MVELPDGLWLGAWDKESFDVYVAAAVAAEREACVQMTITHCPHCGKFIEPEKVKPDGCVCDEKEWSSAKIRPVCDKFVADGAFSNCGNCEHDRECHKA